MKKGTKVGIVAGILALLILGGLTCLYSCDGRGCSTENTLLVQNADLQKKVADLQKQVNNLTKFASVTRKATDTSTTQIAQVPAIQAPVIQAPNPVIRVIEHAGENNNNVILYTGPVALVHEINEHSHQMNQTSVDPSAPSRSGGINKRRTRPVEEVQDDIRELQRRIAGFETSLALLKERAMEDDTVPRRNIVYRSNIKRMEERIEDMNKKVSSLQKELEGAQQQP